MLRGVSVLLRIGRGACALVWRCLGSWHARLARQRAKELRSRSARASNMPLGVLGLLGRERELGFWFGLVPGSRDVCMARQRTFRLNSCLENPLPRWLSSCVTTRARSLIFRANSVFLRWMGTPNGHGSSQLAWRSRVTTGPMQEEFLGRLCGERGRGLADSGGPWFLGFAPDRTSDGPGIAETRRCGDDVGGRRRRVRQRICGTVQRCREGVGCR